MSGQIYDGDQPVGVGVATGATDSDMSASAAAVFATANAEAPVYVFTANYPFVWQGQNLSFRAGVGYQLDTSLLAALQTQHAPIVAA
jgi:hypothetical protein